MNQRLADYVADFFVEHEITECYMVTGGGAMHLNDALGHKEGLHCLYNHHEQACAIAAEAYARVHNRPAAVCVTTGPGGTNAITGVLGAYLDSIPMLVISGQVRYDTTARYMEKFTGGRSLRAVGDQEYDITKSVSSMCKYAVMLEDPMMIKHALEKGLYLATHGRKGPVWIDIPVNFQGMIIETEKLKNYNSMEDRQALPPSVLEGTVRSVMDKIKEAKRPVFYAGNGIRLSGGYPQFRRCVEKLGIPVVTCWDSIDLIENDHPLYTGRAGIMGDRAGNFAIQNADVILAVGNRLSIRQVGYNWKTWARKAHVIMVDADAAELKKTTLHVETPIHADAKEFLTKLQMMSERELQKSTYTNAVLFPEEEWTKACQNWKTRYPVTQAKHWEEDGQYANVYAFIQYLSKRLPEGGLTVVSNGSACVVGSQNYIIKRNSRFLINSGAASMGYGLPAAIGACRAAGGIDTVCIEGDGSIMMNLQELQTIITNNLPIKIFLINNDGYHSIRQTQNNLFPDHSKIGIGPESRDLSFPNYERLAAAFGFPYFDARSNAEMKLNVDRAFELKGPVFCEMFVSKEQNFEPKSATKRMPDGSLISPPLEDLAPFLDRKELKDNMFIPLVDEEDSEEESQNASEG